MRIAIGCDHRGLECKSFIMDFLREQGHQVDDSGCYSPGSVDYPDIAEKVGEAVARGGCDYGILICDTGIGMSIAANKVKGIRAALCHNTFEATRAREHNDANVLCLSARTPPEDIRAIVAAFLSTPFQGGRHQNRVDKIMALEG